MDAGHRAPLLGAFVERHAPARPLGVGAHHRVAQALAVPTFVIGNDGSVRAGRVELPTAFDGPVVVVFYSSLFVVVKPFILWNMVNNNTTIKTATSTETGDTRAGRTIYFCDNGCFPSSVRRPKIAFSLAMLSMHHRASLQEKSNSLSFLRSLPAATSNGVQQFKLNQRVLNLN